MNENPSIENLFPLPDSQCPKCGMTMNFTSHATALHMRPNKPGDIIICSGCGNVNKLTPLGLVAMTKKELQALDQGSKEAIAAGFAGVMAKLKNEGNARAFLN